MDDVILLRINRIYAAIGEIEEDDPQKLKATVIQTDKIQAIFQDFRAGLGDDDLLNQAYSVIHNIANLRDHLRRWASRHGQDKKKVDEAVDGCPELQIIKDLSNNDKHGYPPRDGGNSGRSPQLVEINRVMRLQTQARKGSSVVMTIGAGGVPKFIGDGTGKAVVTGDVVDNNNEKIGDLYDIVSKAVEAWEVLLAEFGLIATLNDTPSDDDEDTAMDSNQYEELMSRLTKKICDGIPKLGGGDIHCGPTNRIRGASGYAHQIDVSVEADEVLLLVECKCWKSKVDTAAVLAFCARRIDIRDRLSKEKKVIGAVATTVGFGPGAKTLAQYFEVELWHVLNEQEFVCRVENVISIGLADSVGMTDRVLTKLVRAEDSAESGAAPEGDGIEHS